MEGFLTFNMSPGIINKYTIGRIMSRENRIDIRDIKGQKFNDLTVIEMIRPGKGRGVKWKCICVCGKECEVYGGHLRDFSRQSCGCRSQRRIKETGINLIFSLYKSKAKKRNIFFNLSIEEIKEFIFKNCFYCGIEPNNELKRQKSKKKQIDYTGIDRIDSLKGYEKENCVPCCFVCNRAKSDLSIEQWQSYLNRLCNFKRITNGV